MSDTYELDDVEIKQTAGLMNQINEQIAYLRQLEKTMVEAEAAYETAKHAYEDFSRNTMPMLFKSNGLDALRMEDGRTVRIVTKTQCSVNKNPTDKAAIAAWLRSHNGEALVKSECVVPPSQIPILKQNNVPFREDTTVNTNSLKAFLLDQLGQKGNPAQMSMNDIPHGCNFFQYDEVEITK